MDAADIIMQQHEQAQKGVLCMWTVYDKPTDHPGGFIARRHDVGRSGPYATEHAIIADLARLRVLFLEAGLTCLSRHDDDDPKIVEVWL